MANEGYPHNYNNSNSRMGGNGYRNSRYDGNEQQDDFRFNTNQRPNNYDYDAYSEAVGWPYRENYGNGYERGRSEWSNDNFVGQRHESSPIYPGNYPIFPQNNRYEHRGGNQRNNSQQQNQDRCSSRNRSNRRDRNHYENRSNYDQADFRRNSNSTMNSRRHYEQPNSRNTHGQDNRYMEENRREHGNRSNYSNGRNNREPPVPIEYDEFDGRYEGLSFSRNRRNQRINRGGFGGYDRDESRNVNQDRGQYRDASEDRGGYYNSPEYIRAREFEREMERAYYDRLDREREEYERMQYSGRGASPTDQDLPTERRYYEDDQYTDDDYSDRRYRNNSVSDDGRRDTAHPISDEDLPPEPNAAREHYEDMAQAPNVYPEMSDSKEYLPPPSNPSVRHSSSYSDRSGFTATPQREMTTSPTPAKSDIAHPPIQKEDEPQNEVEAATNAMQSSSVSEQTPPSSNSLQSCEQCSTSSKLNEPVENLLVSDIIPIASRSDKEKVILTTNMFPLEVKNKTVFQYNVIMKVVSADGSREKRISQDTKEKIQGKLTRDETCVAAMRAALEAYGLIRSGEASVYDGASQFYSSESLFSALKPHSHVLQVSITTLPVSIANNISLPNAESVVIEFGRESQFDLQEYQESATNRDLSKNKPHQQFFDVLTSEPALTSGKFTAFYKGSLFAKDSGKHNIGNGEEAVEGIRKGIAFIQPKNSGIVPALVLDERRGHFYVSQNAVRTVCEMMGLNWRNENLQFPFGTDRFSRINDKIKGIRFTVNNNGRQTTFVAAGISRAPIEFLQEADVTGELQPLLHAARFADVDHSKIRKHWPAIELRVKIGNKIHSMFYPMEYLTVAKHQKVSIQRADGALIKPKKIQERFENISNMLSSLNLHSSSPYSQITKAFGVSISSKPLKIEAIKRQLPGVAFKQGTVKPDKKNATFEFQAYTGPATATDIVVCHDCPLDLVKKMAERLNQEAKALGMKIVRWHFINVTEFGNLQEKVYTAFTKVFEAKEHGLVGQNPVLFYIDHEKIKSHAYLKLFERKFLIISQHLTTDVVEKCLIGKTTRVNILNKLNIKLGGTNYSVIPDAYLKNDWIINGKTLIIGYDVAHPQERACDILNETSVVGISFNGSKNPEAFIGDYHYQEPKHEKVNEELLFDRIQWILDSFVKHRNLPENILILRDGVSEGQYIMVLNEEFQALKDGVEEYKRLNRKIPGIEAWKPKYAVIVVCKRHNKRFALEEKEGVFENALPGTVVDDQAVRKDMTHFYVLAHKTWQGTAKMPSFHVLHYEMGDENLDKVQSMVVALSFSHQISQNSTSLPEPIYQADEWAKRGRENFKVFAELDTLPRLLASTKDSGAKIDYEKLTDILAYRGTSLEGFRLNA